jgi:cellulose synthase operon protein C
MVCRDGRLAVALCVTLAGFVVVSTGSALGGEDARTAAQFVQGLRARGYYDLAAEFLETVRKQPDAPPEFLATADYELGRLLLDEAAKTGDLVRRKDLLEDARVKLDAFTKSKPDHPKTPEALVELARLLVERGHLAMLQADDTETKTEKDAKVAEARASFDKARIAYSAADDRLKAAFAKYPPYLQDNDPRKDEKERTHSAMMQAELQKAVVDYEQGETYAIGSKERAELMSKGLAQFEELYKRYRTQLAGLSARMWQAKCYEERGDLGPAMGIYNELMEHSDPRLRPLQRYVGWFRIITLGKRKEYALAADESVRWLQANNSPEALRSKEGLGVQLELARNIIAQLPEAKNDTDKNAMVKRIGDVLGGVVRYPSPFKAEAITLLKKYKPNAAVRAEDVAKLTYDDAIAQGEQALSAHEWDRAEAILKQAVRRAETARNIDQLNTARYDMAFGYYMNKRYYEALVLADHITRRYPKAGLAPKAAEIGMASLLGAYDDYAQVDRGTDLNNLIELAKYASATYPEYESGDSARMMLGQIYHGTGRYPQAIEAFTSVRAKSSKYLDARTKLGASFWEQSKRLRATGKTAESDAEAAKAVETLRGAMATRKENGATPTDPSLLANACDIAEIFLETSRPDEALKLLEPLAKAQTAPSGPVFARMTADLLRAHIGVNQVDKAMLDMAVLEKAGGEGNLTQLYFGLGKLLQKEMEALKKRGDSSGLSRTRAAYLKFLTALTSSKTGQTYDSLQWAGENMLTLGHPKEAEETFGKILEMFEKDPKFQSAPGAADRVFRTRLKLCAAYRDESKFAEAKGLVDILKKENPRAIEPMMEEGYLVEALAASSQGNWNTAQSLWQGVAKRLGVGRTKPIEYYDAWYHAAFCLNKSGKPKEAKQALALVMRLSPRVGGPEMKQKYDELIKLMK